MIKRFLVKKISLILASVFFALFLFLTAKSSNYNSTTSQINRVTETYTHTLENIPIDIKYDSDEYFISGYSYEVEVYLTSTNRVKLDSEINPSTRSFQVVADLTNLGVGQTKVPLVIKDMPSEVTGQVSPATMEVTIGKKETKKFEVVPTIKSEQLAEGYELKNIKTDIKEVEVTSDEATIDQIDHVMASFPDDYELSDDLEEDVILQAVSENGTILPSKIDPVSANLSVELKRLSKTVPVVIELTGTIDSSLKNIRYELESSEALIFGSQEDLDKTSEIKVQVDISNVKKNTIRTIELLDDNVSVVPETMKLTLTVEKK
ncbi:YbbR-like domain-containing protein [Streptococcus sp. CSL10205-OR2]|uniref:CdaR family protein n=1 Tax=Streptococcus sp. CSL10205-OR2 TaxID=2980558 RepID=UPI0021D98FF9|nr:CdaR family protein [Streptococcus sp. CSL10205-OR2]MCU9533626.1 CdaR family protein [Streptococcus sp. CSL10205-OR2]